jgi:peptidoglycan hydrolase-like protein with peptidoglycan-binding domain
MANLIRDFDLSVDQAAAILGNLGHESAGFTAWQERNPRGGRGGWGWAQWTGDRRVKFEEWARRNGLGLKSDEANYGYLRFELLGPESSAIAALKKTTSLEEGVRVFEQHFERAAADAKHYPQRERYAQIARDAYYEEIGGNQPRRQGSDSEPASPDALSFGMQGPQVRALQETLVNLDYPIGNKDGIFGNLTRDAVLAFQADNGLTPDGAVGKRTWEALSKAQPRPLSRARTTITPKELRKQHGSRIIADGSKTKTLGLTSAIFGLLGLTTSTAMGLGGGSVIPRIPDKALPTLDQLSATVARMGTGDNARAAKKLIAEIHSMLDQGTTVPTTVDHAALEPIAREVLPLMAGALPGVPGSLLVLGLGMAAHFFGNRVIQARTMDHRDGSNLGR